MLSCFLVQALQEERAAPQFEVGLSSSGEGQGRQPGPRLRSSAGHDFIPAPPCPSSAGHFVQLYQALIEGRAEGKAGWR